MENYLKPGSTYTNVFFLFIDAAGHSSVVANNPSDRASSCYDLLENRIQERFASSCSNFRCSYFERWGWQGDGGMFIIHDERESVALDAAFHFAKNLLDVDLPTLKVEFQTRGIRGELHLRVALHRGSLSYISDEHRGSIHSVAINHTAHLEKATPSDCLAITGNVYDIVDDQSQFHIVGDFEDNRIALYSPNLTQSQLLRKWYVSHGVGGVKLRALKQRPSEAQKSLMLSTAVEEVIDVGTALSTCSGYLTSTRRPALFRDAVIKLLSNGLKYKCYILDPSGDSAKMLSRINNEDMRDKIKSSLAAFKEFKVNYPEVGDNLEIYSYDLESGLAGIGIDINSAEGLIIHSPLMAPLTKKKIVRADLPHFVIDSSNQELYGYYKEYIQTIIDSSTPLIL